VLVLALGVVAVASPLCALRWPAGLLLHRWRLPLLIWAAVALQFVVIRVTMPEALAATLHVVTYVVALGFLWVNRRASGVWVVGAGAFSNGLAIALNGGVLPASAQAVASAGIEPDVAFVNSAVLDHPVLPWLGDVFAWPAPLPLANTFSVGDVLIVIGVVVAAWTGTRRLGAAESPQAGQSEAEN
jgi:hypothetical protein